MSLNPFQNLSSEMKLEDESDITAFNNIIENIFFITINESPEGNSRPRYLYYLKDYANIPKESLYTNLDDIIFERIFTTVSDSILTVRNGYENNYDDVLDQNPLNYLFNSYIRLSNYEKESNKKELFNKITNSIILQSAQYIVNSKEISPLDAGVNMYYVLSKNSNEPCVLDYFSKFFDKVADMTESKNDTLCLMSYFSEFFSHFLKETFLNKPLPSSNILGIWKDPLQTVYCPMRKVFVSALVVLVNIPIAAELLLDFSSSGIKKGIDFERCLLGRILCSTHLPNGIMQTPEFFTNIPLTRSEKNSEEQKIWQMTKFTLNDCCEVFMTIFKQAKFRPTIKLKLLNWFGKCLTLNESRNNLLHSLNALPSSHNVELAGDGFFMNLMNVLFHIGAPLVGDSVQKILSVQIEFASDKEQCQQILEKLTEETKLVTSDTSNDKDQVGIEKQSKNDNTIKYTALTQLFYLLHKCYQLSFHVVKGRLMELNQQLHRMQEVMDDLINNRGGGINQSPEREQLRKVLGGQVGVYLCLSCAMRQPDMMQGAAGLATNTCRLLVSLARKSFEENCSSLHFSALLPEFVLENIIDWASFLRHFDDGYFETSGFSLEPILQMTVLYMGSPKFVKNPHLRSKIPALLECLIPLREETPTEGLVPPSLFLREQLFRNDQMETDSDNGRWVHDSVIEALFSAFTTMELSAGEETVRFEEKFEYRRPMYACLKYFYGKEQYDCQIKNLEKDALNKINDAEAPLCLKFLNLLINDATFLLDEALSYLVQLKVKEIERTNQGGRYQDATAEADFQHMVTLTNYHNTLALSTIDQMGRMANLCPDIMVHPILVDRIACTLNYFLDHLVGPKRQNLTVKDKESYAFKPKELVQSIARIYVALGKFKAEFREAVVKDGRSYSDQLLASSADLVTKVTFDHDLSSKFQALVEQLKIISAELNEEEENFEDPPEEFCDPIMGTIMKDPVTLPSSGVVVDKKTIFRHLLSDPTDPFNRQPLSMIEVKSNDELKTRIFQWIQEKKESNKKSLKIN